MQSTTCRRLALLLIGCITLYVVYSTSALQQPALLAAESPLAQPWPTLVVNYPPHLDGLAAAATPATQEVRVSFLFHSPLPLPTPLPDALSPTTTLTVTGDLGEEGWLRSPATLTFAITDNLGAGVSEYRLAGSDAWIEREYYYPPPRVGDEGRYTLEYRSIDMAHNVEAAQSRALHIDFTAPQLDAPIVDGNLLPNGWYNRPVAVHLAAADALSGLAGLERLDEAGLWQASGDAISFDRTGQHRLVWRAVDRAGNASAAQELTIQVDRTPPTTTHTLTPTLAAALTGAWFNQPLTVTLHAVDEGAGLAATSFRLDDASSWLTYTMPIRLDEDGRYALAYASRDRALNDEPPHTVQLAIDRAPPTVTYTVNGVYPPPAWVRSAATLVVTASDALAGVAQVDYALDGDDWQPYAGPIVVDAPGQHQVTLQATDAAGNRTVATAPLAIDATPPQATLLLDGGRGPNGWFVTPITMTLTAADGESGVGQYQFRLNDGPWQTYEQPLVISNPAINQISYRALDQVGNEQAANLVRFNLDLRDPSAQALIRYGESSASGWFVSPVTFALTGADGESGLQRIDYRLDDGDWQPYTAAFTLDQGGQHHLAYRAVDYSGRLGATQTISASIDLTPPHIQSTPAAQLAGTPVNLADSFVIFDDESDVVMTTLLLDGAPYQPDQPLLPGEHVVEIQAVNGAGLSTQQTQHFVSGGVAYLPLVLEAN